MGLKEVFFKFMSEYADIYDKVWREKKFTNPLGDFITKTIPSTLYATKMIDANLYKIKGSYGQGRWTKVPWIAIFDTRLTQSATKGVYIVYLFNKDTGDLYLTLNQATTGEKMDVLRKNASKIREELMLGNCGVIDSGSEAYDAGCIWAKKYQLDEINDESILLSDLHEFMRLYDRYFELVQNNDWWPSVSEYDPSITKEQWLSLLNNNDVFTEKSLFVMAALYDIGGQASCVQLEELYGKTSDYYRAVSIHLAERIIEETKCSPPPQKENSRLWPVLYVGRDAKQGERGRYIWKLRTELRDALEEFGIRKFLKMDGEKKMIVYKTGIESKYKRNRIVFGAPGTGKSYTINNQKDEMLGSENDSNYERVTFHPDYSYANFVGTYKPVMVKRESIFEDDGKNQEIISILQDKMKTAQEKYDMLYDRFKDEGLTRLPILLGIYSDENFKTRKINGMDAANDNSVERNHGRAIRPYLNLNEENRGEEHISYEYVPGPFTRVLVNSMKSAMSSNPQPHLLIVEEINRANVAAVFGDIFQLLDRDKNGISEYEISTSNDMRAYLAKELGVDESSVESIKIPDNMFIWATMNSADQGVFPMDTAFKRRWDFTYLGIDDAVETMSETIRSRKYKLGKGDNARCVSWDDLRSYINNILSSEEYNINEDKLMGPYFISRFILENADDEEFIEVFKNKVLMYLFDDAVKQKKKTFFEKCRDEVKGVRYSDVCKKFEENGVFIFPGKVAEIFKEIPNTFEPEENVE